MADFLKSLKIKGIEIDPAGATTDQILKYNGTKFVPATGGGGASNIDDLGDVTITSAAAGDYLTYNGTAWINDAAPSYLQLDTSVGSPTSVEGKIQWDSDFGTISFGLEGNNSVQQIGMNQFAYCYNADSVTLAKGTPVYIFGGQGSQVSIKRALNTGDATSATTLGLVSESIAAGASGYVCTYGVLQGIDTTAYNEGDILYLGATAGTLTTTKPSAPNHYVFVGVVIKDDVGGEIWLRPQNGFELDEIHNVSINAGTLASGDFLKYNGTLWVNDPINLSTDTTGNYVASLVAGTGVTLSNNSGEGATPTVAIGQAVATTSDVSFKSASLYGDTDSYLYGGYLDIYTVSYSGGLPSSVLAGTVGAHPSGVGLLLNGTSGAPVYVNYLIANNASEFQGTVTVQQIREKVIDSSISSNVMTLNYSLGAIRYQETAPSANFTVNVTNLPTDNGNAITVSVFVTQGSTGYYPSALQIDGVSQTIKWAGGTAPTPTSSSGKIDLFTFTLIRRSSAWTVLGSANLNY